MRMVSCSFCPVFFFLSPHFLSPQESHFPPVFQYCYSLCSTGDFSCRHPLLNLSFRQYFLHVLSPHQYIFLSQHCCIQKLSIGVSTYCSILKLPEGQNHFFFIYVHSCPRAQWLENHVVVVFSSSFLLFYFDLYILLQTFWKAPYSHL